jgi:hypothetical protein
MLPMSVDLMADDPGPVFERCSTFSGAKIVSEVNVVWKAKKVKPFKRIFIR